MIGRVERVVAVAVAIRVHAVDLDEHVFPLRARAEGLEIDHGVAGPNSLPHCTGQGSATQPVLLFQRHRKYSCAYVERAK